MLVIGITAAEAGAAVATPAPGRQENCRRKQHFALDAPFRQPLQKLPVGRTLASLNVNFDGRERVTVVTVGGVE